MSLQFKSDLYKIRQRLRSLKDNFLKKVETSEVGGKPFRIQSIVER